MLKVKVRWGGFIGSPGWSNFFFDTGTEDFYTEADAVAASDRVQTFFTAIKGKFPNTVNFQVQSDVEAISPTTGELQNIHNGGVKTAIAAGGTAAPYSAASGAVMNWRTAGVRNGRRVRGRTFFVPLLNGIFESDGTIAGPQITDFVTHGTTLIGGAGALKLGVWARPTAPGAADGAWFPVTSCSMPDLAAVLRSRRD